jgi:hypothetical protein
VRGDKFYKGQPTCYWRERVGEFYTVPTQPSLWLAPWRIFEGNRPRPTPENTRLFGTPTAERAATAVLVELIRDEDPAIALYAMSQLIMMQPPSNARVPALLALLRHPELECRRLATQYMLNICAGGPEVVTALTQALDEDDVFLNANAACVLAMSEGQAKEAVPALLRVLRGPRANEEPFPRGEVEYLIPPTLAYYVGEAIKRIDPEAARREGLP